VHESIVNQRRGTRVHVTALHSRLHSAMLVAALSQSCATLAADGGLQAQDELRRKPERRAWRVRSPVYRAEFEWGGDEAALGLFNAARQGDAPRRRAKAKRCWCRHSRLRGNEVFVLLR